MAAIMETQSYHAIPSTVLMEGVRGNNRTQGVITNGVRSWCFHVDAPAGAPVDIAKLPFDSMVSALLPATSDGQGRKVRTIGIEADSGGRPQRAAFFVGGVRVSPFADIRDLPPASSLGPAQDDIVAPIMSLDTPAIYCRKRETHDGNVPYWLIMLPETTPPARDIRGRRVEVAGMCFTLPEASASRESDDGPVSCRFFDSSPVKLMPGNSPPARNGEEEVMVSPVELRSKYVEGLRILAADMEGTREAWERAISERLDIEGKVRISGRISRRDAEPGWRQVGCRRDDILWAYKLPRRVNIEGRSLAFATLTVPAVSKSKHQEGVLSAYFDPDEELVLRMPIRGSVRPGDAPHREITVTASALAKAIEEAQSPKPRSRSQARAIGKPAPPKGRLPGKTAR